MPNLIGVWDPQFSEIHIREILENQFKKINSSLQKFNQFDIALKGFGGGLLDHGILENGVQPVMADKGRWILFLDGEIFNLKEILKKYRDQGHGCLGTPPELCLKLLVKYGDQVIEQFNGLFCIVLYDCHTETLKIISDRYSFRPIFYLKRGHTFLWASELKGIIAGDPGRRKIDEMGLLSLFSFKVHVNERTWLDGYRKLPPASILRLNSTGLNIEKYWEYQYDESAQVLDQASYFTGYRVLLDRAVERCMTGQSRKGIFLSGGYDSRTVAASIQEHHLPLPAFTFGYEESRDVQYARMLAERLGFEHHSLNDSSPYLLNTCRDIVWRSEGMLSFYDLTSVRYHSFIKSHVDILLLGFLGEFGGSHTWPALLLARDRKSAIAAIFSRLLGSRMSVLRRVFHPVFLNTVFDSLKDEVLECFDSINNDHPLNIADSWQFHFVQHRGSFQSPSVDRPLFEARAPHLDAELLKFLLTIPPYARIEQRVYKKMIAYGYPEIRDIPCANSGKAINPRFAQEYLAMAFRYMGRKVASPFRPYFQHTPDLGREFRDPAKELRNETKLRDDLLLPWLSEGVFPEAIFNSSEISKIIQEHYHGKANHAETIFMLVSVGLAFEFFLYETSSQE